MMKRTIFLLAMLLASLPLISYGQEASPTPPPDPHVYNDPGMQYRAPSNYVPVGQRRLPLAQLTEDPTTVAGWVFPDKQNPKQIFIQLESYNGDLDGFDSIYEQQLRERFDNAIIRVKEHASLSNGMPALYMEMSAGEGFSSQKAYMYIWIDGARGVALVLSAQIGQMDTKAAKQLLSDASAVRYPIDRE